MLPIPVTQIWKGFTIIINPNFSSERNREWIGLVALELVRTHQRRPDDPDLIYRIGEAESHRDGRLLNESGDDDMNIDDEVVDDDNVMIDNGYDRSIAVDAMLGSFEPSTTPIMQGEEGRGFSRLDDLSGIEHVVVVGLFFSGTDAMCEYPGKYFNVTVHPPRLPKIATGWIGDMSAPNYSRRGNHWQVGGKHLPPLNSENATKMLPSNSLFIQMIREPLAWVETLVKSHYSLFPDQGMKRGGDKWEWLSQRVKLDSHENEYRDWVFSNVIDLWACYAHGYLSGRFTAGETTSLTTTVRREDLVAYPTKIINGLAPKNLKRKLVNDFFPTVTPIDEYVGGGRGSQSSRELALQAIKRGRFIELVELRHWATYHTDSEKVDPHWSVGVHPSLIRNDERAPYGLALLRA